MASGLSLGLARVARAKECGEAACDDGDDEDGPHLEADIDNPAGHRERVLDLRRNGQQLHGGEEGCVTESFDIPTFLAALEYPGKHCAGGVDQNGQAERKYQAREQAPVSFFNLEESGQFFSYHNGSPSALRSGARASDDASALRRRQGTSFLPSPRSNVSASIRSRSNTDNGERGDPEMKQRIMSDVRKLREALFLSR